MELYPRVMNARHAGEYRLVIEFSDGAVKTVDFEEYIGRGGVFAPLADETYFRSFFIDLGTICWPNGADVAPERLYEKGTLAGDAPEGRQPRRQPSAPPAT